MVSYLHLKYLDSEEETSFFPDLEKGEKKQKVFFDDLANDVKFFNKDAPVKQISTCIISEDGSVRVIVRKPIRIRIKHGLRRIFTRRKYKGKTIVQWIGRCCFSIILASMGITLGYVTFIYLLFLSLAAFW